MPVKESSQENRQPEQEKDNPLKNTEMSLEDNYNNIDGVINNVSADTKVNNPVLEKICQNKELKIERQRDKIENLQNRVRKNVAKSKKLRKAYNNVSEERKYLKTLVKLSILPRPLQEHFENSLSRQEDKSGKLLVKIDKLNSKYTDLQSLIEKHNNKIQNLQSEIGGIQKIDRFLSNMHSKEGRRENFITALTDINNYSIKRKTEKISRINDKIKKATAKLEQATTGAKKLKIRNSIAKLIAEKEKLTQNLDRLQQDKTRLNDFNQLSDDYSTEVDNAVLKTAENIQNEVINGEVIRSGSVTDIFDKVVEQSETPLKNVFDEIQAKNNQLKNDGIHQINELLNNMQYSKSEFGDYRQSFVTALTKFNNYSLNVNTEKRNALDMEMKKIVDKLPNLVAYVKANPSDKQKSREMFNAYSDSALLDEKRKELSSRINTCQYRNRLLKQFEQQPESYALLMETAISQTVENIRSNLESIKNAENLYVMFDSVLAQSENSLNKVLSEINARKQSLAEEHMSGKFYEVEAFNGKTDTKPYYFFIDNFESAQRSFDIALSENKYSDIYLREFSCDENGNINLDTLKILKEVHSNDKNIQKDSQAQTDTTRETINDGQNNQLPPNSEKENSTDKMTPENKSITLQELAEKICPEIDKSISENFVDARFNAKKVVTALSEKFDIKDVQSVVALNIKSRGSYDGRVSTIAKNWATGQPITDNISKISQKRKLSLNSHTGLLNIVAEKFAREREQSHTFSAKNAVIKTTQQAKQSEKKPPEKNLNTDQSAPTRRNNQSL